MIKKIIILAVSLFSLNHCNNIEIKDKYEGLIPYIEVEKTSLKEYKNINIDEYILKFENRESFVCFFYSTSCSYCHKLIENVINPYIKETNNLIYGLDVYEDSNYERIEEIEHYQPIQNDYFSAKNSSVSISRPITQVNQNGKVIDYEKGYTIKVNKLLKAYIKN